MLSLEQIDQTSNAMNVTFETRSITTYGTETESPPFK